MQEKKKSYIYSYLFQEYRCVLPTVIFTAEDCWGCYGEVFTKAETDCTNCLCRVYMRTPTLTEQSQFSQTK